MALDNRLAGEIGSTGTARLTRRRLLQAAGAMGLALGTGELWASGSALAARENVPRRAKKGGTATIAPYRDGNDTSGFYPEIFVPTEFYGNLAFEFSKLVYTPLVMLDAAWKTLGPGLATSWQWSADYKTLTMSLRKGVTFHDGVPFTARDVLFTIQLMTRRDPYPSISDPTIFEGGADYKAMKKNTLPGVEIVDPYTVRFHLTSTSPFFLMDLSDTGILPAHAFDPKVLNSTADIATIPFFTTKPIGTGPFKVQELVQATHVTFAANKQYFKGAPLLDRIVCRIDFKDQNALYSSLEAGDLDCAWVLPATAKALQGDPNLKFLLDWDMVNGRQYGVAGDKPYMNTKVRQALAYAIDRKTLSKTVLYGYGRNIPADVNTPGLFPNPTLPLYDYNPVKAKQLLAEGHWDPNRQLKYGVLASSASASQLDTVLMDMFRAVGVQCVYTPLDPANEIKILTTYPHSWDIFNDVATWTSYNPVPQLVYFTSGAPSHVYYDYSNPRFDALVSKGIRGKTLEQALGYFRQAQTIIATELPVIPYIEIPDIWVSSKRFHGGGDLGRGPLNDIRAETWWKE